MSAPNLADLARFKLEEALEIVGSMAPFQTPMILEALLALLAKDRDYVSKQLHNVVGGLVRPATPDERFTITTFTDVADRVKELLHAADPNSPLPKGWGWLQAIDDGDTRPLQAPAFVFNYNAASSMEHDNCGGWMRGSGHEVFGLFIPMGRKPSPPSAETGRVSDLPADAKEGTLDIASLYDEIGGGG